MHGPFHVDSLIFNPMFLVLMNDASVLELTECAGPLRPTALPWSSISVSVDCEWINLSLKVNLINYQLPFIHPTMKGLILILEHCCVTPDG